MSARSARSAVRNKANPAGARGLAMTADRNFLNLIKCMLKLLTKPYQVW